MPDVVPWRAAPMVFVEIPVCPRCGSTSYHRLRTEANGDGSVTKRVCCRQCLLRFKIVLELPETGNDAFDVR